MEKPTNLAAIQAFAMQQPVFREVELTDESTIRDGIQRLADVLREAME